MKNTYQCGSWWLTGNFTNILHIVQANLKLTVSAEDSIMFFILKSSHAKLPYYLMVQVLQYNTESVVTWHLLLETERSRQLSVSDGPVYVF